MTRMTQDSPHQRDPIAESVASSSPRHLAGALLGLAVGDALGTTLEFQELKAPDFPGLATGPHRSIIGGGPFGLAVGQVTDDTHMACCLFQSLVDRRAMDAEDVARRYLAWRQHAFDIGGQTAAAISKFGRGTAPGEAGRAVWEVRGRQPAGNGSLMRTAPIGVLLSATEALRRAASFADSGITHFDPRCQLACAAFNAAIAHAVREQPGTAGAVVEAARSELHEAARDLAREHEDLALEVERARDALAADLDAAAESDPRLYGSELHLQRHQGFVRVAFRLAFWELVHAPTLEAALIDVVNRGGDADTNAAITGALLGAFFSADAIPRAWIDTVLAALQDNGESPFRDVYHPRIFVQGLEALAAALSDQ
jgi:ADP-ribosyl-[dinitrogen reductase] hydrolase